MTVNAPAPDYRFGRFVLQPAAQRLLVDGKAAKPGPARLRSAGGAGRARRAAGVEVRAPRPGLAGTRRRGEQSSGSGFGLAQDPGTGRDRHDPRKGLPLHAAARACGFATACARRGHAARPGRRGSAIDRRAAVRQHQRRRRERVFRRRPVRGAAQRPVEDSRTARGVPDVGVQLQGRAGGHPDGGPEAQRGHDPRRQRAQGGLAGADHRAARPRRHGLAPVVADLRPRAGRHLRRAGRHRARRGHGNARRIDARGLRRAGQRAGHGGSAVSREGAQQERGGVPAPSAGFVLHEPATTRRT